MNACRLAVVLVLALPACSLSRGTDGLASAESGRRRALEYGVRALEEGDYRAALERIAPIAAICPTDELGRSAMLLLATAELDPRNPNGRPDVAAELTAFQLARRAEGQWEGAAAAHLYTLALDYGAEALTAHEIPGPGIIWDRYLTEPAVAEAPIGADATDGTPTEADVTEAQRAARATRAVNDAADGGPRCDVADADADVVLPELTGQPMALRTAAPPPVQPGAAPAPAAGNSAELQAEVDRLRAELARKEQELDRIRRTLRP